MFVVSKITDYFKQIISNNTTSNNDIILIDNTTSDNDIILVDNTTIVDDTMENDTIKNDSINIFDKTKYIGKMIKGDEFNKIYSDTKFIKLVNRNDRQFETGLNVYHDEIDSLGAYISCDNNGILFTDIANAPLWIYKNTKDVLHTYYHRENIFFTNIREKESRCVVYRYMRYVTIPDDALVFVDKDSFRTNQIILSEKENITADIYINAVKYDRLVLAYMPYKSKNKEICLEALKYESDLDDIPTALKDYDIYLEAVKVRGYILCIVPENLKDRDMCLAAVMNAGTAIQYVPESLMDKEICEISISYNGALLYYVPDNLKDDELCMTAVKQNNYALLYVPTFLKTKEMCMIALNETNCGKLDCIDIEDSKSYMVDKKDKICLFKYVPNSLKDKKMCILAVSKNEKSLKYVPDYLNDIDICRIAVKKNIRVLKYVPDNIDKAKLNHMAFNKKNDPRDLYNNGKH